MDSVVQGGSSGCLNLMSTKSSVQPDGPPCRVVLSCAVRWPVLLAKPNCHGDGHASGVAEGARHPSGRQTFIQCILSGTNANFTVLTRLVRILQGCASPGSPYFIGCFLGNFPGWWADTVVIYCLSKASQLSKKNITKIGKRGDAQRCTYATGSKRKRLFIQNVEYVKSECFYRHFPRFCNKLSHSQQSLSPLYRTPLI